MGRIIAAWQMLGAINVHMGWTVNAGGTLAPGNPIGSLTIGNNLTPLAGSTTVLQVQHSPPTNDAVQIGGTLTAGGALIVTNSVGTAFSAGDSFQLFSAGSYGGSFAVITLPALTSGLAWDTNSLNSAGVVSVVALVPKISNVALSGTNLVLQGGGGLPNGMYYVLGSTNVALPLPAWTRLTTNPFDATGNFSFTNAISPAMIQQFYLLQLP